MFKKLLSNLPYNPSLIGELSFYYKRVRAEESIRRLGLIFVVLAMFVQTLAVFNQPQPTMAQSANDIIPGGFVSKSQATDHCNANYKEFKDILSHYGITCSDVANAQIAGFNSSVSDRGPLSSREHGGKLLSMGRIPYNKAGERPVEINGVTYYQRYLWAWDSTSTPSQYNALVGTSASGMYFAILYNCGNLTIIEQEPTPTPEPTPEPEPQPEPTPTTEPEPVLQPSGTFKCESLTPFKVSRTRYRFTARASGSNYNVKRYTFDFGDGYERTVSSSQDSYTHSRYYREPGTYTATATIYAEVANGNGGYTARSSSCSTKITAEPLPEPTPVAPEDVCPYVDGLQTSRSECDVCPQIPGTQSNDSECRPCEASESDEDIVSCIALHKSARNITQDIDNAHGTTAQAGDVIEYELSVTNNAQIRIEDFEFSENIADVLEYATLESSYGGTLANTNIISWPTVNISAGKTATKRFRVKVKNPIPQTPISISNPGSYDLTMTNVYGDDTVEVTLPPSITKITETVVTQELPNTGPVEGLIGSFGITSLVGFMFARTRIIRKETEIAKDNFANGIL